MNLPAALQSYDQKYQFRVVEATVTKVAQWSESRVSSSGVTGISIMGTGAVGGGSVKTRVTQKSDVWFCKPDGKELNHVFSGEQAKKAQLREGHKVFLVYVTHKKKEYLSQIINCNTDQTVTLEEPIEFYAVWQFPLVLAIHGIIAVFMGAMWAPLGIGILLLYPSTIMKFISDRKHYEPMQKHLQDIRNFCLSGETGTGMTHTATEHKLQAFLQESMAAG